MSRLTLNFYKFSTLEENPPLYRSNTECNDSKDYSVGALLTRMSLLRRLGYVAGELSKLIAQVLANIDLYSLPV